MDLEENRKSVTASASVNSPMKVWDIGRAGMPVPAGLSPEVGLLIFEGILEDRER